MLKFGDKEYKGTDINAAGYAAVWAYREHPRGHLRRHAA